MIADAVLDEYFDEEDDITPQDVGLILWALGEAWPDRNHHPAESDVGKTPEEGGGGIPQNDLG